MSQVNECTNTSTGKFHCKFESQNENLSSSSESDQNQNKDQTIDNDGDNDEEKSIQKLRDGKDGEFWPKKQS